MNKHLSSRPETLRANLFALHAGALALLFLGTATSAFAQDSRPGPIAPPPEHRVRRVGVEPRAEAPPPLPAEEILRRFAQKEDGYLAARARYAARKIIRVQEFGSDGNPAGEYQIVMELALASDGKLYERVVTQPPSTLRFLRFEPEDLVSLVRFPAFPLVSSQLPKYDLTYMGKEQVDEINAYLFRVKPKAVERTRAYFEGLVWVDDQFLEVVKTYGKWVTETGDVHSPQLPFTFIETYRENVEGKYWFPAYARSDDSLLLKDGEVRLRLTVRWTDYKPLAAPANPPSSPPPALPKP